MALEQEVQATGGGSGKRDGGRRDGSRGDSRGDSRGGSSYASSGAGFDADMMDQDGQEGVGVDQVDQVGVGLEEILRSVPVCDDVFLQRLGLGRNTTTTTATTAARSDGTRAITDKAFLPLPTTTALVKTSGASSDVGAGASPDTSAAVGVTNWDDSFQVTNCLYAFRNLLNLQVPCNVDQVVENLTTITAAAHGIPTATRKAKKSETLTKPMKATSADSGGAASSGSSGGATTGAVKSEDVPVSDAPGIY